MHGFHRDLAIVAKVVRQVDIRHTASADLPLDCIAIRQGRLQTIERFYSRGTRNPTPLSGFTIACRDWSLARPPDRRARRRNKRRRCVDTAIRPSRLSVGRGDNEFRYRHRFRDD
jgi:hypothetical protein